MRPADGAHAEERCDVTDALDLALAQKVLAAQPFSNLLGARLVAFGEGEATLELDIRDDLRQQNGFLHAACSPTRRTTP